MEVHVGENNQLVEVWLPRSEQNDPKVQRSLALLYQRYRGTDCRVAVFCSGVLDLREETSALLRHNQKLRPPPEK